MTAILTHMQTTYATAQRYGLHSNDRLTGERIDEYVLRVKDLPEEQKPREKLARLGARNLDLAELIAALLGVGTTKEEVFAMAKRIVREYGEKALAGETNPAKMAEALDIPLTKATQLIAAFELGRRFYATQSGRAVYVRNAQQAYEYVRSIGFSTKEQLRGLYLNSRYEVIQDEVISVGSLTANIVHPREVFRPALERGAVAIIIAHNHPSGNPEPTTEDIEITAQLVAAGKLLGIDLLDHLVVTTTTFIQVPGVTNA